MTKIQDKTHLNEKDKKNLHDLQKYILENDNFKTKIKQFIGDEDKNMIHTFNTNFEPYELFCFIFQLISNKIRQILETQKIPIKLAQLAEDIVNTKDFSFLCSTTPLSNLKMDLLLSELKETICNEEVNGQIKKENDEECLAIDINKKANQIMEQKLYISFLDLKYPIKNYFKKTPDQVDDSIDIDVFKKEDILYILTSNPVIETFVEVLKNQNTSKTKEEISSIITTLLGNNNFFLFSLPFYIKGLTGFDGSIFINLEILNQQNYEINIKALILLIFIREVCFSLIRICQENQNYTLIISEKEKDEPKADQSYLKLEDIVISSPNVIYLSQSIFILQKKSYEFPKEKFEMIFNTLKQQLTLEQKQKTCYNTNKEIKEFERGLCGLKILNKKIEK